MSDENSNQESQPPAFARFLSGVSLWALLISITIFLVIIFMPVSRTWRPFEAVYITGAWLTLVLVFVDFVSCVVVLAVAKRLGERFAETLKTALWSLAAACMAEWFYMTAPIS